MAACALALVSHCNRTGDVSEAKSPVGVPRAACHPRHAVSKVGSAKATFKDAAEAGLENETDMIAAIANDPRSERAWDAVHGLAGRGDEAVKPLADALAQAATPEQVRLIATALAMIGSTDAVNVIWAAALAKTESPMRSAMMEALDNISSQEGVNLTASALVATTDPDLVAAATRVLSRGATADTVDFIQELHADPAVPPHFRPQLVAALRLIESPAAVTVLEGLAGRADLPELAAAAAESLSKQGTGEAALALANAYANTSPDDPFNDSLRRVLVEKFANLDVTPDNQTYLSTQAKQSTDPALRDAARQALALAALSH